MRFNEERQSSTDRSQDHQQSKGSGPLIVVSNRQPYRHEYADDDDVDGDADDDPPTDVDDDDDATADDGVADADADANADSEPNSPEPEDSEITVDFPTGGLTAGLDPVLQQSGGTWIAWSDGEADRAVTDDDGCVAVPPDDESYTLQRLWLSEEAVEGYYYGFSNRVLWPICHEFPELVENRTGDQDWYQRVNRTFADAIVDHATEDAVVWLQDYHLALAPAMVREDVPDSTTIAQFWHIPWPNPQAFRACPNGRELLEGLLGNDLLGFHIDSYVETFLACVDRFVPEADVDYESRQVRYESSQTQITATPMGVDAESYDRTSRSLDGSCWRSLRERYDIPSDVAIGLGVDRLDYSKGIPERLAAVERLLERNPEWHEQFTFFQKATPSRTDIPAYAELGEYVRHEVDRINARFATRSWEPIVYTEDYVTKEELCTLYRRADVMLVSPLLDGMNLVAQEFVAASVDGQGALVLSERAGATETLGDDVFTIDPTRADEFATTIDAALTCPEIDRQQRMTRLRQQVFDGDLEAWMDSQFAAIDRIHGSGFESSFRSGSDSDSDSDSGPEPTSGSSSKSPANVDSESGDSETQNDRSSQSHSQSAR
ncbi:trehalose-6-phosphate synthase [Halobacteria archaeon AArc-m2/3/4]|uniref:Trehalose-6-phosphate synthase n=1 Tax=Natronoglomus mannanivorans TaxID=2979990 RepID=A0ABT2QH32_9EURY|nr:trehalose-6-phosphate synthase [Halobacteria archaeon AArc-m2/3/4]